MAVYGHDLNVTEPVATVAYRHQGVDYGAVPASLVTRAVKPGDPGYEGARSTYVWPGSPGLVLRPQTPQQVVEALAFARTQDVPLAVRSGGHGIGGRSTNDGGIVIDLGALNSVEVIDRARRLVRVAAGARWGDVAEALAPHGLAISSGDHGGVGVGGLATSGGQGFLARSYGLTLDHVVGAEVVLADGRIVRTDSDHHRDLFWAVRGAGGNMGIVTSLDIEAAEVGDVVFAVFVHEASDTAAFLHKWGRLVEVSPRELTAFVSVFRQRGSAFAQTYAVWAGDDTVAATAALQPFMDLAPVLQHQAQAAPYAAIVAPVHHGHYGQAQARSRSVLLDHLDAPTTSTVARMLTDGDISMFQIRSIGAAVNDTPADTTAYAHRTQNFALNAVVNESRRARAEQTWAELDSNAIYLNFESHGDATSLAKAFPPPTLERLRAVKAAYDPDNIFRTSFPILPAQPLLHTEDPLSTGDFTDHPGPDETAVERWERAHQFFDAKKYTEAARLLADVVAEAPEQVAPRLLLARSYYHSAQLRRAEDQLREVIARDPVEHYAHLMLGRTLQRQGCAEEAEHWLRMAAAFTGDEA
jgi:FAD/FMN-containing dehydrogenase